MIKSIKEYFSSINTKDERIKTELDKITAKLYPLMMALLVIVVALKISVFDYQVSDCIMELIAVVGSIGYIVIRSLLYPVPIKRSSDEHIRSVQDMIISHSYYGVTFLLVFGEFILMLLLPEEKFMMITWYIPIWFIPAAIYTVQIIRKGLFISNSKQKKQIGLKKFKSRAIAGSIFFGVFTGWSMTFTETGFQPFGLLMMLVSAVLWGVPFYFIMKLLMNKSEEVADRQLEDGE